MALPDGHLGVARRPGAPELSEKQILVHTLGGIAEQAAEITRFKKAVDEVEDILDAGLGVFDDWQHQVSHHTDTLAQNSLKLASMLTAIRDAVAEMRPVFDDDLESPKEGRHE
jgi:ABC-type transporter Mla subunit MlaD